MTPLQIKMILHYYVSVEPYSARDLAHANSRAVHEQRDQLIAWGMLRSEPTNESEFSVTEKGMFYIDYLLSVPVPSTKFVIEFPLPF